VALDRLSRGAKLPGRVIHFGVHRPGSLRTRSPLGNDEDINTSDTSTPIHNQISGPITQTRVGPQNYQVTSFLASYSSYLDNGNVHSLLLLRNDG
jgi:hypothetical protein